MTNRYGIAEWFGEPFRNLPVSRRQSFARVALGKESPPLCPFQSGKPPCRKKGGVCSISTGSSMPVITCPRRFDEANLIPNWLGQIAGFNDVFLAREVPFMRSPTTGRAAGRIDLVVAGDNIATTWFGLEIQAVYFSGKGMQSDFEMLLEDEGQEPPLPTAIRRPDWRSSSAKRLMPQLQVKGPTLRRWGTKLAVAVDLPFFEAIGGLKGTPSHDFDEGDIVWLVPRITEDFRLKPYHWEVLSLEDSSDRLLAAETVKRRQFENILCAKLKQIR